MNCTCGHPQKWHFQGAGYCKLCAEPQCQRPTSCITYSHNRCTCREYRNG